MVCTICKAVLVTARRNRCTSCTSAAARLVAPLKAVAQKQVRILLSLTRVLRVISVFAFNSEPCPMPNVPRARSFDSYRWYPLLARICRPSPRHASPSYRRKSRGFTYFYTFHQNSTLHYTSTVPHTHS